jgi:hypothetical protein
MRLITRYFLVLTLFFTSCKKELVEIPESNQPVFSINGSIGEENIKIEVDENLANFKSSYDIIEGVKFFKGTLTHSDFELEIGLFDGNIDKSSLTLQDLSKISELAVLENSTEQLFYVNKYYFNNPEYISKIEWYVNSVFYSENSISINTPGKYAICAKIYFEDQTNKIVCNDVILGYHKNAVFSLEHSLDQTNKLNAWIYQSNVPVSSVDWYIDGVFECTCIQLEKVIDANLHEVKAVINFQNGVKRTRTILVDGNESKRSIIDFAFLENLSDRKSDYKVKVKFKKNGDIFQSDIIENNVNKFVLEEIKYIGLDENSNNVYSLKGRLIVNLYCTSNGENKLLDLKVAWGIVIK